MDRRYRCHDGPATAALSAQIIDLYWRCYAAPPWSESRRWRTSSDAPWRPHSDMAATIAGRARS